MLPLDDPRWKTYEGGYRGSRCDAPALLQRLFAEGGSEELWYTIFDELHHQGDVGSASYAAVPHLVEFARTQPKLDWNVLGMIALIELERPRNPEVPEELAAAYFQSIADLPALLAQHPDTEWDENTMSSAAACLALARGQRAFARVYFELDLDSGKRWLREDGGGDPEDDEDEDADSDEESEEG